MNKQELNNVVPLRDSIICEITVKASKAGIILSNEAKENAEDRKKIVEWLRAHNGDHIIEHDATVSADDMDKLSANDIPFIENTVVNTQRLKSFLKDGIGATTGVQQFTIEDIPACVHFQEVTTVEIDMKG